MARHHRLLRARGDAVSHGVHRRGGARRLRSTQDAGDTAMSDNVLLSVEDLSVEFAVPGGAVAAVRHVSFDIDRGEPVAMVGESGSGKSVTALSVLQLLPYPTASPPSGPIRFLGPEGSAARREGQGWGRTCRPTGA